MAVIVSTSMYPNPNHMWVVNNSIFRWIIDLSRLHRQGDSELISRLEHSLCFNLLSFPKVHKADPNLAIRLRELLLALGKEMAAGLHIMRDENGEGMYEESEIRIAGSELVALLEKWPSDQNSDNDASND